MNTPQQYPTYTSWLNALEAITREKLALDLADLPQAFTGTAYDCNATPGEAFNYFIATCWADYAPLEG